MSTITPDRYNDFGKISYINQSYYIPGTFCVGSVGQYIFLLLSCMLYLRCSVRNLLTRCSVRNLLTGRSKKIKKLYEGIFSKTKTSFR